MKKTMLWARLLMAWWLVACAVVAGTMPGADADPDSGPLATMVHAAGH